MKEYKFLNMLNKISSLAPFLYALLVRIVSRFFSKLHYMHNSMGRCHIKKHNRLRNFYCTFIAEEGGKIDPSELSRNAVPFLKCCASKIKLFSLESLCTYLPYNLADNFISKIYSNFCHKWLSLCASEVVLCEWYSLWPQ